MCIKINRKVAFFIQYSRTKKSKYCWHPPPYFLSPFFKTFVTHPPKINEKTIFKKITKIKIKITVVTPPLSSDPDNPQNLERALRQ